MKKIIVSIFMVLFFSHYAWSLSVTGPVTKISGIDISPQEFSTLPEFLQAKIKYHHFNHGAPVYQKWQKRFGADYQHFHHWAAAIVKLSRAVKITDKTKRNFALGVVVTVGLMYCVSVIVIVGVFVSVIVCVCV